MPGIHDLKRQINSVKSTQQITKAMELVAASKMKRAQDRAFGSRPYTSGLEGLLTRLKESKVPLKDPLMAQGNPGPVLYVLVTADRGLCGGYNANMLRFFTSELSAQRSKGNDIVVMTVGRKGRDFCKRTDIKVIAEYPFEDHIGYAEANTVVSKAIELFLSGAVSEVRVLFTSFISTVAYKPTSIQLLPVVQETPALDGEVIPALEYILEPSPAQLLKSLLPKYVATQVLHALLEAKASELGAKMVAMGSATDNAEQMIETLSLKFNRERQAAITREISEIVGGAEALK